MKLVLSGALALALLGSPAKAQDVPTQDKLKSVLETLRQLNKLPTPPAADSGMRTRGAQKAPASPDPNLIKELGSASVEFLKKHAVGQVIYGDDNRKNYDNATANEKRAADATAVFVRANQVISDRNGTVRLASGQGKRFCSPNDVPPGQEAEPFWDQPRPGFCSGFKVGPNLIATAGHCVKATENGPGAVSCKDLRVVFGFRNSKSQSPADRDIPAASVYQCVEVVAGRFGQDDPEDWRIIRVDRVVNAPQVTVRMEGRPPLNTPLTVVGHPSGLPVTIADGASVRVFQATFFQANLDTYGGNSGSPVFNGDRLRAGELFAEGILVRGEDDFLPGGPCLLSKRCQYFEWCRGEDVTYSSLLGPSLKRFISIEATKR